MVVAASSATPQRPSGMARSSSITTSTRAAIPRSKKTVTTDALLWRGTVRRRVHRFGRCEHFFQHLHRPSDPQQHLAEHGAPRLQLRERVVPGGEFLAQRGQAGLDGGAQGGAQASPPVATCAIEFQ